MRTLRGQPLTKSLGTCKSRFAGAEIFNCIIRSEFEPNRVYPMARLSATSNLSRIQQSP
jgi:hypothetical protein